MNPYEMIRKLDGLKWTDEKIANRLKLSVEEVQQKRQEMLEADKRNKELGCNQLAAVFTSALFQYEELGKSLAVMASGLAIVTPQEVHEFLSNPENDALAFCKNYIVLRAFKPEDLEKILANHIAKQHGGGNN